MESRIKVLRSINKNQRLGNRKMIKLTSKWKLALWKINETENPVTNVCKSGFH